MPHHIHRIALAAMLCAAAVTASAASSAASSAVSGAARQDFATLRKCSATETEKPVLVTLGKSTVLPLAYKVVRMATGGAEPGQRAAAVAQPVLQNASLDGSAAQPGAQLALARQEADGVSDVRIALLAPDELFVLGRKAGTMNTILQDDSGRCHLMDVVVSVDPEALQAMLADLVPGEQHVKVRAAQNHIVLTGEVSDATTLADVLSLAGSYADGTRIVNMLRVGGAQQVMLEVKIAEVSKTLLDKLGSSVGLARSRSNGIDSFALATDFLSKGSGVLQLLRLGRSQIQVDGQKEDGLVRVLAEPNIMAISGQQASFLSGGKIFVPVARDPGVAGYATITLEEKEFGIGVKFTPTVLGSGRVNLKMVSEVSDLSQTGSPFTSLNGVTSVLPSFTVRRADTTVQLNDGQSFVIAGLIKNNTTETIKSFPGLGDVPLLGALFRSSEFQKDQTELMFVITPRLVKPMPAAPSLPTDHHTEPSRLGVYLNGSLEGGAAPADKERSTK